MGRERTLSIITTGYFLLYSLFLTVAEGALLYGIYLFHNGATATAGMLPAVDEIITAVIGFFAMFSTFSWVVSLILAAALMIPLIICIAIFIHSCICLRRNPSLEKGRLKRDAFIKTVFYIGVSVLLISQTFPWKSLDIGSIFMILAVFILPFFLSLVSNKITIKYNKTKRTKRSGDANSYQISASSLFILARVITEKLLNRLLTFTDQYRISQEEQEDIANRIKNAACFHL